MRRFASIWPYITNLARNTDITLQYVPNREYTLRLFVEDEEIELRKIGKQSWTPSRVLSVCRDISSIPTMRVELQMRTGHSVWAKTRQNSDAIDLRGLFSNHLSSTEREFMVSSDAIDLQSLINDLLSSTEREFTVSSQSRPLPVYSFLIEEHRGRFLGGDFRVTILFTHLRPSLFICSSQPANSTP